MRDGVGVIHVFAGKRRVASVRLDGRTQFCHSNHLGSPSVVTDSEGEMKQHIEYYPFGRYRVWDPPVPQLTFDFHPGFPQRNYTFTDQEDDEELGLYNYGARLYDPILGRFLSADAIVQAPDDPQTLNRYSYARNNPIIYTDPSGNFFLIDDIIAAISSFLVTYLGVQAGYTAYAIATAIAYTGVAASGAVIGAGTATITGGDVGLGAVTGAISALTFFGVGEFVVPEVCSALGAGTELARAAVTVGVHTAAGAVSGAINGAITDTDIGMGALTGGVGAGIGAVSGGVLSLLKVNQFGYQFIARTVTGGIAGGVVSEIYGGNFWEGFGQGAATAVAGFLFNEYIHQELERYVASRLQMQDKFNKWIQEQGWRDVEIEGEKVLVDKSGNPIGQVRIVISGGNLDLIVAGAGIAKTGVIMLTVSHPATYIIGGAKIVIGLSVIWYGLPSVEIRPVFLQK